MILRFGQQQRQRRSEIKKCRRRQHFPPKLPTAFWPTKWPVSTVNCFVRAVELLGAWGFWRFVFRFCSFLRGSSYFLNQFGYFGTYSSQLLLIATKTYSRDFDIARYAKNNIQCVSLFLLKTNWIFLKWNSLQPIEIDNCANRVHSWENSISFPGNEFGLGPVSPHAHTNSRKTAGLVLRPLLAKCEPVKNCL